LLERLQDAPSEDSYIVDIEAQHQLRAANRNITTHLDNYTGHNTGDNTGHNTDHNTDYKITRPKQNGTLRCNTSSAIRPMYGSFGCLSHAVSYDFLPNSEDILLSKQCSSSHADHRSRSLTLLLTNSDDQSPS